MAFSTFVPPNFSTDVGGSPSTAWRCFKEKLKSYFVPADLQNCADETKIAIRLYCLDQHQYWVILNGFDLSHDQRKEYVRVVAKFNEHFEPKKLTKLHARKFDSCYQEPKETVNGYVVRVCDIAVKCNFGTTLDDQLIKQLSVGVRTEKLRKKLWADVSLAKLTEKCQLHGQREQTADLIPKQQGSEREDRQHLFTAKRQRSCATERPRMRAIA